MSAWVGAESAVIARTTGDLQVIAGDHNRTIERAHEYFVYVCRRVTVDRFVTAAFDGAIKTWSFQSEDALTQYEHGGQVFSLSLSADSRIILSAGDDQLKLWDLNAGELIWHVDDIGSGNHTTAALNPEAMLVASVGEDNFLRVWEVDEPGEPRLINLPDNTASAIEFLTEENSVVLSFAGGQIYCLNLESSQLTFLHADHEDWVRTLRTRGPLILSVSQNGTARVYDRGQGKIISRLSQKPVHAADFVDGSTVAFVDALGNTETVTLG